MSNYPTFYAYLKKKILRFQKKTLSLQRNLRIKHYDFSQKVVQRYASLEK